MPTPAQALATHLLGVDVFDWIAERREFDKRRPWRVIANELAEATDGQVTVTGEALRLWLSTSEPVAS